MKDFSTLVRIHRWELDERRQALADIQTEYDRLAREVSALDAELGEEGTFVRESPEAVISGYGHYVQHALTRRKALLAKVAACQARIDAATEAVREAFETMKTYELAEENRQRKAMEKAKRDETLLLDEMALESFRRKSGDR